MYYWNGKTILVNNNEQSANAKKDIHDDLKT